MAKSEWDQIALKRLLAKLEASNAFLALLTDSYKTDPTCLIQLGYAIMLEKPIILIVPEGVTVPPALQRVADHIAFYKSTEDLSLVAAQAIKVVTERDA